MTCLEKIRNQRSGMAGNTSTALIAVIIMNCWVGIPFNMLLLVSGLTSISPDVYESASMDGANWGQRFLFITLPLMKEVNSCVLMLGFIYTFRAFDLMYIMTAGGPLIQQMCWEHILICYHLHSLTFQKVRQLQWYCLHACSLLVCSI